MYLTRHLGPTGYGMFVLATSIVFWLEWTIVSLFGQTTVKFVAEADDWHPFAGAMLRLYLWFGIGAAAVVMLLARPLARLLHEPQLDTYLGSSRWTCPCSALP